MRSPSPRQRINAVGGVVNRDDVVSPRLVLAQPPIDLVLLVVVPLNPQLPAPPPQLHWQRRNQRKRVVCFRSTGTRYAIAGHANHARCYRKDSAVESATTSCTDQTASSSSDSCEATATPTAYRPLEKRSVNPFTDSSRHTFISCVFIYMHLQSFSCLSC